jgi:hypothetical protein
MVCIESVCAEAVLGEVVVIRRLQWSSVVILMDLLWRCSEIR